MFPFGKKPESADPVDDAITTKTRVFEKPSTLWPKGKTLERTPEMIEEELERARAIELAEQKDAERAKLAAAIENVGKIEPVAVPDPEPVLMTDLVPDIAWMGGISTDKISWAAPDVQDAYHAAAGPEKALATENRLELDFAARNHVRQLAGKPPLTKEEFLNELTGLTLPPDFVLAAKASGDINTFTLAPYEWCRTEHQTDYGKGKNCIMRWRLTNKAIYDFSGQPVTFALPPGKTTPDYDFMFMLEHRGMVQGEEITVIDFDPAKYKWAKIEMPVPLGGLAGLLYGDSVPHAAKEEEWPKRLDTDLLSFDEIMQLRGQALNAAVATLAHLNPPYRQRNCAADIVLDIQETVKAFEHYLLTGKWQDD